MGTRLLNFITLLAEVEFAHNYTAQPRGSGDKDVEEGSHDGVVFGRVFLS
ncbi:MAG TPA: hypothetical protein VGF08_01750 [Terriglobales bacterium]|jgi:hypothetical protein